MTLEVPDSLTLPDGSSGEVKAVAARVIDGSLAQIVYTVEHANGAWVEVEGGQAVMPNAGGPLAIAG